MEGGCHAASFLAATEILKCMHDQARLCTNKCTSCEHDVHIFMHSHMAVVLHYAFLVPHVNWALEWHAGRLRVYN